MQENQNVSVSSYRWVVLAIMWLAMFVSILAQFQVAALSFQIIPELNISPANFAMLLAAPMLPAVLFSLIAGSLADKFGVKRVVAASFVFSTVGIFFRYIPESFLGYFVLMFFSGFTAAFLNANAPKLVGAWFPREQVATALGIYFVAIGVGTTIALATTALFPAAKNVYITTGIAMVGVGILWLLFVKNRPEGVPLPPVMPALKYIGVAARSRSVWLVGLALMFFTGAHVAFVGFLPDALGQVHGVSPVQAGLIASVVPIGVILGNIFGPIMSARIGRIKPFLAPVAFVGAVIMYLSWTVPGIGIWPMLFIAGFFLGVSAPLLMSFPMLLPEIGSAYAGSAGGIIATLQLMGGFFIPSFIIAAIAGHNFTILFALASLFIILMGIVSLFLPELGTKARNKIH